MLQFATANIVVNHMRFSWIVAADARRAAVAVNAFTTCAVGFDLDLPAQSNVIAEVRV
jgi:hypothetical protein